VNNLDEKIEQKTLNLDSLREKRKFSFKLTNESILNDSPSFINKVNVIEFLQAIKVEHKLGTNLFKENVMDKLLPILNII
jgi:hypothetical protein